MRIVGVGLATWLVRALLTVALVLLSTTGGRAQNPAVIPSVSPPAAGSQPAAPADEPRPDLFIMAADGEIEGSTRELCALAKRVPSLQQRYNSMQIMRYLGAIQQTADVQRSAVLRQNASQWGSLADTPQVCFGTARKLGDGVGTDKERDVARSTGVYVERTGPNLDQVWVGETYIHRESESRSDYIAHSNDWKQVAQAIGIYVFQIPQKEVIVATLRATVTDEDRCGVEAERCVKATDQVCAERVACVRVGAKASLSLLVDDTTWASAASVGVGWSAECDGGSLPMIRPLSGSEPQGGARRLYRASVEFRQEDQCRITAKLTTRGASPAQARAVTITKLVPVDTQVASALLWGSVANDRIYATYRQKRWAPFVPPSVTSSDVRRRLLSGLSVASGAAIRDFGRASAAAIEASAEGATSRLDVRTAQLVHQELQAWGDLLGYRLLSDGRTNLPVGRQATIFRPVELNRMRPLNFCAHLRERIVKKLVAEGLLDEPGIFDLDSPTLIFESACAANGGPEAFLKKEIAATWSQVMQPSNTETKPYTEVAKRLVLRRGDTRGAARYRVMTALREQQSAEVSVESLAIADEYPDDAMANEPVVVQGIDDDGRLSTPVALRIEVVPREPSLGLRLGYVVGTQTTDAGVNRERRGADFGLSLRTLDEWLDLQFDFIDNTNVSDKEEEVHGEKFRFSTGALVNLDCVMQYDSGLCPALNFGFGGGYEWFDQAIYLRGRIGWRLRTPSMVQFIPHLATTAYIRRVKLHTAFGDANAFGAGFSLLLALDMLAL